MNKVKAFLPGHSCDKCENFDGFICKITRNDVDCVCGCDTYFKPKQDIRCENTLYMTSFKAVVHSQQS